jgi:ABC-type Fe3+/spermidine/putrescine transport system ATPase subunit
VPSLVVLPGEIVAVMGPSGSGKSTLLAAIAGFLPAAGGAITWEGADLLSRPPEKRRAAVVFQSAALFPHLTVAGNVEFAPRVQGVPPAERRRRAGEWLGRLGIAELADRRPTQISGGQAQRVALARALAAGFPILLLDEPFSALDAGTRGEARSLVRKLVTESRVACVLVTHDQDDTAAIADRVLALAGGRVVDALTPPPPGATKSP